MGPTHTVRLYNNEYDVQTQIPFQWSTSNFKNVVHAGHPDLFNFDWIALDNIGK